MRCSRENRRQRRRLLVAVALGSMAVVFFLAGSPPPAHGQDPAANRAADGAADAPDGGVAANGDGAENGGPSSLPTNEPAAAPLARPAPTDENKLNLLALCWDSFWFMVPIVGMSLIVVAVTGERIIGMRSGRTMPTELMRQLGAMQEGTGFDPRRAYRLCQEYPSVAATVIKAMLLRVGRPQSEVAAAVADASQREADRMNANVRWLRLAGAITPLMGLFGTVWGMIVAFHETTVMPVGQNKAEFLAHGIYLALVTTLGGLAVAMPAVMLAFYFEGRIESLFHRIDELLFHLTPQIEKFEGRVRFNASGEAGGPAPLVSPPPSSAAASGGGAPPRQSAGTPK